MSDEKTKTVRIYQRNEDEANSDIVCLQLAAFHHDHNWDSLSLAAQAISPLCNLGLVNGLNMDQESPGSVFEIESNSSNLESCANWLEFERVCMLFF